MYSIFFEISEHGQNVRLKGFLLTIAFRKTVKTNVH